MNRIVLSAAAVLVAGCMSGDEFQLDKAVDEDGYKELRRRLNVRVLEPNSSEPREVEPAPFASMVASDCSGILSQPIDDETPSALSFCDWSSLVESPPATHLPPVTCGQELCRMHLQLCTAHRLMEVASTVEQITLNSSVTVPPQSTATNAGLEEQALEVSRAALFSAMHALRSAAEREDGACDAATLEVKSLELGEEGSMTYGASFANGAIEAYHLAHEASDAAVRDNLAVADGQFSLQPDFGKALKLAQLAPVLSRVHAAHLLSGGEEGLEPFAATGMCPSGPKDARIEGAIEVFRESAIPPRYLDDIYSLDDVLMGSTLIEDSVTARLSDLWGLELAALEPIDTDGVDGFYSMFGLSRDDFAAAREHLAEENEAFARDPGTTLPPRPLAGETSTGDPRVSTFPLYAATAVPPISPPGGHYEGLVRDNGGVIDDRAPSDPGILPLEPTREYAERGLAQLVDYAVSTAFDLQTSSLADDALDPLALLVTGGIRERPYRVELCYRRGSTVTDGGGTAANLGVRLLGAHAVDDKLLVRGVAGLSCAERGHVEGVPCSLGDYVVDGSTFVGDAYTRSGFDSYVAWSVTSTFAPAERLFVLEKRDGGIEDRAGDYELLAGMTVEERPSGLDRWAYCNSVPVVPEIREKTSAAVEPSTEACHRGASSCAGLPFDQKLPLEDELSDDGDPYESSWRHYLGLARSAADEADRLGDELIEAGLRMDQRAEEAIEELESLCGTITTADGLIERDLSDVRGGSCSSDADCTAVGRSCVAGTCIRDPLDVASEEAVDSSSRRRLNECLSADSVVPFVSLGSRPVCLWHRNDDPNVLCEGSTDDNPCPSFARPDGTCPAAPAGNVPVPVPTQLGFFASAPDGFSREGGDPPCDAIRRLRNSGHDPRASCGGSICLGELGEIIASSYFDPDNVRAVAGRIGWEARPGDFSAVLLDGSPWISTGDPYFGPETGWPCDGSARVAECGTGQGEQQGLFCSGWSDCDNQVRRALINDRLARAVIALRLTSGVGLDGVYVPYARGPRGADYDFSNEGDRTDYLGRGLQTAPVVEYEAVSGFLGGPGPRLDAEDRTAAYCFTPTVGFPDETMAWITVRSETGGLPILADCTDPSGGKTPLAVIDYGGEWGGYDQIGVSSTLWSGLGERLPARSATSFGPLFRNLLTSADRFEASFVVDESDPAPVLSRGTPDVRALTSYWHFGCVVGSGGGFSGSEPELDEFTWDVCERTDGSFLARTYPGNAAFIARTGFTAGNMMDAMELACEAGRELRAPCDFTRIPKVKSAADVPAAQQYLRCIANEIERRGELTVFPNVPQRATDSLGEGGVSGGAYPALGGEYSAQVEELRRGFVGLSRTTTLISDNLRGLSNDMEQLRIALARVSARKRRALLDLMSTISSQQAACAAQLSPGISLGSGGVGLSFNPGAAIATCSNAAAQINITNELHGLTSEDLGLQEDEVVSDFVDRFNRRATAFQNLAKDIAEAQEQIDAALARLESLRRTGQRALAKATFADSDPAGRHYNVNTVMRRRLNTLRVRYEEAHGNAVRMTFLARRAIEQRLGMDLSDVRDDMSLVPAPARWVDRLCEVSGIDYEDVRTADALPADNYADQYIGDYVTRLENVVESYRLDFPFQNGSDTVVVSLRDELANVRAPCPNEVSNLLAFSGELDSLHDPDPLDPIPGWRPDGCDPPDGPNCVVVSRLTEAEGSTTPLEPPHPELSEPRGYRVSFGASVAGSTSALTADTHWVQDVELSPGRYRLSWYALGVSDGSGAPEIPPTEAVTVLAGSATPALGRVVTAPSEASEWPRHYVFFDVSDAGSVRVALTHGGIVPGDFKRVDVAGLMLEDVTGVVTGSETPAGSSPGPTRYAPDEHPPPEFIGTHEAAVRTLPTCEDTTGEVFRSRMWRRGCLRLCADGYGRSCAGEDAETQCYWETEFSVTQRDIEAGRIIHSSGFALGNYNYRTDTLALNFVGTATRDCSDDSLPSTCYSAAYIPYTITHLGPYTVRNHAGETYDAPLFRGHIEHGRGLAAERYITNPLSSADEDLITPYLHREFRGRPLDGTYRLRVWDAPGVRFDNVEDVQVVLNYRYWTRFE